MLKSSLASQAEEARLRQCAAAQSKLDEGRTKLTTEDWDPDAAISLFKAGLAIEHTHDEALTRSIQLALESAKCARLTCAEAEARALKAEELLTRREYKAAAKILVVALQLDVQNTSLRVRLEKMLRHAELPLLPEGASSAIIESAAYMFALAEWLPVPEPQLELLWRASENGWSAEDFHRSCSRKGTTLTVVKDVQGYVFGGFTAVPWTGGNATGPAQQSPEAFLFTLCCHAG
eukprot:SAG11_NODE_37_length_21777_cov_4.523711_10_plen_234_part_00